MISIISALIPAGLKIQMNEWAREPDPGNKLTEKKKKKKQESESKIIFHFCALRALGAEANLYIFLLIWKNISPRLERQRQNTK